MKKQSSKAFQVFFLLSITSSLSFGQAKWKPITQQTKPWSRWWWEGNAVNPKDLTYNMETYQKAGFGRFRNYANLWSERSGSEFYRFPFAKMGANV